MSISTALRQAVKHSGRSQYEIAASAELSASQLSRFARGLTSLDLRSADRLADALGLKLVGANERGEAPRRAERSLMATEKQVLSIMTGALGESKQAAETWVRRAWDGNEGADAETLLRLALQEKERTDDG